VHPSALLASHHTAAHALRGHCQHRRDPRHRRLVRAQCAEVRSATAALGDGRNGVGARSRCKHCEGTGLRHALRRHLWNHPRPHPRPSRPPPITNAKSNSAAAPRGCHPEGPPMSRVRRPHRTPPAGLAIAGIGAARHRSRPHTRQHPPPGTSTSTSTSTTRARHAECCGSAAGQFNTLYRATDPAASPRLSAGACGRGQGVQLRAPLDREHERLRRAQRCDTGNDPSPADPVSYRPGSPASGGRRARCTTPKRAQTSHSTRRTRRGGSRSVPHPLALAWDVGANTWPRHPRGYANDERVVLQPGPDRPTKPRRTRRPTGCHRTARYGRHTRAVRPCCPPTTCRDRPPKTALTSAEGH